MGLYSHANKLTHSYTHTYTHTHAHAHTHTGHMDIRMLEVCT